MEVKYGGPVFRSDILGRGSRTFPVVIVHSRTIPAGLNTTPCHSASPRDVTSGLRSHLHTLAKAGLHANLR